MLFVGAIAIVGLVWLYIHLVTQPQPKWTDFYRRSLSRPLWAEHFACEDTSEFVSWAGIVPGVWECYVQPSIALVAASLQMQPVVARILPSASQVQPSLLNAAVSVYYVHLLAGVAMTPVEACEHALKVYYGGDSVVTDPDAAALRLAESEVFDEIVPATLERFHSALKTQFQVRLQPVSHVQLPSAPVNQTTDLGERRKSE